MGTKFVKRGLVLIRFRIRIRITIVGQGPIMFRTNIRMRIRSDFCGAVFIGSLVGCLVGLAVGCMVDCVDCAVFGGCVGGGVECSTPITSLEGLWSLVFYIGGHIDKFIGGGSSLLLRGPGAHTGPSISGPIAGSPSQLWWRVIIGKPLGGPLP